MAATQRQLQNAPPQPLNASNRLKNAYISQNSFQTTGIALPYPYLVSQPRASDSDHSLICVGGPAPPTSCPAAAADFKKRVGCFFAIKKKKRTYVDAVRVRVRRRGTENIISTEKTKIALRGSASRDRSAFYKTSSDTHSPVFLRVR